MTDPLHYFDGGARGARSSRTLRPLRELPVHIREMILAPRLDYIKRLRQELHRLRRLVLWARWPTDQRHGGMNRYILRFIQQQLRDTRRLMQRGVDGPNTPAIHTLRQQQDDMHRAMVNRNWGPLTLYNIYGRVATAIQERQAYDGVAGDDSLPYGPGL